MTKPQSARRGEPLKVHPHCLIFFVDETGHEHFTDPNYPVFGLGGCAILAAAIEPNLREPWRLMKARHFGGAEVPLHASELRQPSSEQLTALGAFFRQQSFGRFAVTMTSAIKLPIGQSAAEMMPHLLRRRWEELTSRFTPLPVEVAFIHEGFDRAVQWLDRYFGESVVVIDGNRIPVHHGIMQKGDEALEVADFVVQAAGNQARRGLEPGKRVRKDFEVIFHSNSLWSSFHAVEEIVRSRSPASSD
jgi:hypothetical protein